MVFLGTATSFILCTPCQILVREHHHTSLVHYLSELPRNSIPLVFEDLWPRRPPVRACIYNTQVHWVYGAWVNWLKHTLSASENQIMGCCDGGKRRCYKCPDIRGLERSICLNASSSCGSNSTCLPLGLLTCQQSPCHHSRSTRSQKLSNCRVLFNVSPRRIGLLIIVAVQQSLELVFVSSVVPWRREMYVKGSIYAL